MLWLLIKTPLVFLSHLEFDVEDYLKDFGHGFEKANIQIESILDERAKLPPIVVIGTEFTPIVSQRLLLKGFEVVICLDGNIVKCLLHLLPFFCLCLDGVHFDDLLKLVVLINQISQVLVVSFEELFRVHDRHLFRMTYHRHLLTGLHVPLRCEL